MTGKNLDSQAIAALLEHVSPARLRSDLFHLSKDPLRYRKANYTRPGQTRDSLSEADEYISSRLRAAGCEVTATGHRVQAFRCDETKPIHHWYATPDPSDPWYTVQNLHATCPGATNEIVQLVAHKDSMSWIDSPGAHDNCSGTVVALEIARIMAGMSLGRTVRFLFCNEEHTPWTSRFAAEEAAAKGDEIVAVFNIDAVDGKSDEAVAAGRMTHAAVYSTDEGRELAELVRSCKDRYRIPVNLAIADKGHINDDDGMFINAGFRRTLLHIGSWPYGDSQYHLPGDVPERVDVANLAASARLVLATVAELCRHDRSSAR